MVAVDARRDGGKWRVFIEGGRTLTDLDAYDWCLEAESLGAGELLITSMDRDGTREGYDVEFLKLVSGAVKIPIIASGGAGEMRHALEAFDAGADAALLASLLHFGEIRIRDLKNYLAESGVAMRI